MAGLRRVVGVEYDGSSVSATFGRHEIPLLKASYADMLETEVLRNMGSQTQDARTAGTYKTEPLTTAMRSSIFRARLMPLFPTNGGGNIRIAVVINFSHPDIGADSDQLIDCRCVNWAAAMENSAKALEIELKWELRQILWTSARKTLNALSGSVPAGASAF